MKNNKLKILMAAAECAPFAKVGGLADVVGTLPIALKKQGVDARVILPLYGSVQKKKYKLKKIYSRLEIPTGEKFVKINIWQAMIPESRVEAYFIEADEYFGEKAVYLPGDNSERFLFFSLAALHAIPIINFKPDIIHCHDSHVALMTDILKISEYGWLKNIKTLLTIHNFNYQGKTEIDVLRTGNLSLNSLRSLSVDARDGDINFMAQGVLNADLINTVSKTYAREITTSFYGAGLERVLRKRKGDVYGIVNGIDTKFFDPAKDDRIVENYSVRSLNRKFRNKLYLQKKLGLPQDKNIALAALVSRLVWQKGVDLFTDSLSKLNCQFVFLGTGQKQYEEHLLELAKKYPERFSVRTRFDSVLAQQIYAGADMFLMPSRFEPCGLGQMIAMRYGTVPVVRLTGGLKDTVNARVGFSFSELLPQALYKALEKALAVYYSKPGSWRQLQVNGMHKDWSWNKPAQEYIKLYKKLV